MSLDDLRERWSGWRIGLARRHGKTKMNRYRAFASRDDIRVESDWDYKPSAAMQALAGRLEAAGYEPKEKEDE